MKRALLIAGGTLGGLGAVMAITPPQLSSTSSMGLSGAGAIGASTSNGATASATPAASATQSAVATATKSAAAKATAKAATTKKATATKSAAATKSATPAATNSAQASASPTQSATPVATKTTAPAVVTKATSGTFTGPSIFVNYGNVQVQITVNNGKITDAKALVAPSGRSQRWSDMAVPQLRQQTLAAQSSNIQGASGASYTSYGWYKSLQGALAKAGL